MAWFLRAVQLEDGHWACRQGRREYDTHACFAEALAHLRELAGTLQSAELFAHPYDGGVVRIEEIQKTP